MSKAAFPTRSRRAGSLITAVAAGAVLAYALLAGLRSVSDTDLFWQLRDARYLVETGHIARSEAFSYTAPGRPWMYPQGAGLIFYALFRIGGFAAISWFGAFACLATAAALVAIRPGVFSALLVGLAVPLVAWRTSPRADLFTTLLFAVFLLLLLRGIAATRWWLLPLVMAAWVNLHPGFVLGLALIAFFLLSGWLGRAPARGLVLAGALSVSATLLNPFGPRIWQAVWLQWRDTAAHRLMIREWWPSTWSWWRLTELPRWRDPDGAFWTLFFAGCAVAALAVWKRRWLPAVLVVIFAAAALSSIRFQALFGICVAAAGAQVGRDFSGATRPWQRRPAQRMLRLAGLGALLALSAVRSYDLVTDRYYFGHLQDAVFGAGLSKAFPARAADFILRERLPGRLAHDYSLGGYLSWRLFPPYPVFIDGRAIPFGERLLNESQEALRASPGSDEWRAFVDRWGIQTFVMSLDRFLGFNGPIGAMCASPELKLVYLDEVSAIFVRTAEGNRPWTKRLGMTCDSAVLPPPPAGEAAYVYWAQAARVFSALGREQEAFRAISEARHYFTRDPELDMLAGRLLQREDRAEEALAEFREAVRIEPGPRTWFSLGEAEANLGHHREAIRAFEQASRTAPLPFPAYRAAGQSYLALNEPREAVRWLERAARARDSSAALALLTPGFTGAAYADLARARFAAGDAAGAERDLLSAVQFAPLDATLRLMRAEFYLGQGKIADALRELEGARLLGASGPAFDRLRNVLATKTPEAQHPSKARP